MIRKIHYYGKGILKRILIVAILIITVFLINRLFALINQEILGAIIFIIGFSIGIMYYYLTLFETDKLYEAEYILSIVFIFFLTILMFAVIYSEPIENSDNYFLQFGEPYIITFPDAFYFSAMTITTLGYGDITPVGVFRLFVIIEVFMGIVYTGSMVYFIVRTLEKKR